MQVSPVNFTARYVSRAEAEERRENVGKVAVGTSAVAATGSRAGFKMFNSSKKVGYLTKEVTDNIKLANKPIKQTTGLFRNFGKMVKKFSKSVSGMIEKAPLIGKFVKSKFFMGVSSALGFGLAVLTMITSLTNIAKTTTTAYSNHIENSNFLRSVANCDED